MKTSSFRCRFLALFLIFISVPTFAFGLNHYCRDSGRVGRVQYTCEAMNVIHNQYLEMKDAYRQLKRITSQCGALRKFCKKFARSECEDRFDEESKDSVTSPDMTIRECVKEEATSCISKNLNKGAQDAISAIRSYLSECELSLQSASSCEQAEARRYCKQGAMKRAAGNSPPTDCKQLRRLTRLSRIFISKYKKRKKSLKAERKSFSRDISDEVNAGFGCDITHSKDECEEDRLVGTDPELKLFEYVDEIVNGLIRDGAFCEEDDSDDTDDNSDDDICEDDTFRSTNTECKKPDDQHTPPPAAGCTINDWPALSHVDLPIVKDYICKQNCNGGCAGSYLAAQQKCCPSAS